MSELLLIDIMNHPWEADQSLWIENFQYEEFKTMARTTFKSVFKGQVPDGETLLRSGVFAGHDTVQEVVDDMDALGYETVFVTATKMWSPRWHHEHILDYSIDHVQGLVEESGGRIQGAGSYDPFRITDSLKELERAVTEFEFRYVWFHPLSYGFPPNDRRFYPLYAKCVELDIAVGLQVGHSAEPLPSEAGRPMLVDEVAIDFPELRINLSHTGWPWVEEWCSMIWRHPNVYGDISAYFPASLDERLVRFMDSSRGRDKVLFGTNGLGLERCRREFLELPVRDETKELVGRDNARRFLKLDES